MHSRRTTTTVAAALLATALAVSACDLVDQDDAVSTAREATVQRRFEGRTLLVVQPARVGTGDGLCRADTAVACSLSRETTYELLGGPSRVSLVNAKVVEADDGSWGVQARFARESEQTLATAQERAAADGTALLLIGNGNRVLLSVPTEDDTGRLVLTTGDTEPEALAVIASLSEGS